MRWLEGAALCLGAIVGGLLGAWMLKRVNEKWLRAGVVVLGAANLPKKPPLLKDDRFAEKWFTSPDEVDKLRSYFETSEWSPIVRERSRHDGENTDVMVKIVNGETHGMFVLEAEPKELTIVLILGPIRLDELGRLAHISGLGALGDVASDAKVKDKIKDKEKERDGGTQ